MKFILLPILCLAFASLNAQNLVPNSSFEEHSSCPVQYSQLWRASPWFCPTDGTTDYFNACDTFNIEGQINAGVPNNFFGYQDAHSGQAYVGICLNTYSNSYREYLEVKLAQPLQPKKKYTVSFYYSPAESAKMMVKSLGVYFSKDSLLQSGYRNFQVIPQVNYDGDFMSDTGHWMLFNKSFIASGGENYLVLGNFKDQFHTEIASRNGISLDKPDIAYLFVDAISVSQDTSSLESKGADLFYVRPNLTMGEIAVFYYPQEKDSEINFRIFNLFGQVMSQSELNAGKTVLETGTWSAGYYFFEAKGRHVQKNGKFLLQK